MWIVSPSMATALTALALSVCCSRPDDVSRTGSGQRAEESGRGAPEQTGLLVSGGDLGVWERVTTTPVISAEADQELDDTTTVIRMDRSPAMGAGTPGPDGFGLLARRDSTSGGLARARRRRRPPDRRFGPLGRPWRPILGETALHA